MSAAAILDAPLGKAWPQAKLADVADVMNGGTPKSNVAEFWDGEHKWLTPADMGKMVGREISQTPRTITAIGLAKSSARLAPPKSVILSTRAPIGHLAINAAPMAFNQGCRALVPGPKLDHVFLYYFLLHSRDLLNDLGTGTTFKELSATSLKTVQMPLPPLEEQKQIVALLDQAFAALDRARALAEANLADSEKLLGATIAGVFASSAEGTTTPLGEISDFNGGSQPPKSQFVATPREGYIRLLQIRDFSTDEKAVYIPDDGKRRRCSKDDIMIARYGASVGQIHRGKSGCYNVALIRTSPDPEMLNRDYFYYYLKSDLFQKPLLARSSRGAQDGFNKADIADLPVPVPPLARQVEMVTKIAAVERQAERLALHYRETANRIGELRQSILQKAFAGELT